MPLRFFLTDDVPDLEDELRRIGHEVVGGPAERVTAICSGTDWHPSRYDPRPFIRAHRPDVCLFVSPLRIVPVGFPAATGERGLSEYGYHRDHMVTIRGIRNCLTIGLARVGDDPTMTRRYRSGMCPKCVVGPQSLGAWATADEATAVETARERRCALWRQGEGGAAGLVAMVESMQARGQYRGGKDAVPFRP